MPELPLKSFSCLLDTFALGERKEARYYIQDGGGGSRQENTPSNR